MSWYQGYVVNSFQNCCGRRLSLAARQRALAEFDERIVIEKTLAVHRDLLPGFQKSPNVHRV